jgi:hypothetical protein
MHASLRSCEPEGRKIRRRDSRPSVAGSRTRSARSGARTNPGRDPCWARTARRHRPAPGHDRYRASAVARPAHNCGKRSPRLARGRRSGPRGLPAAAAHGSRWLALARRHCLENPWDSRRAGTRTSHQSVGAAHRRGVSVVGWARTWDGRARRWRLIGRQWKCTGRFGGRCGRTARKQDQTISD